MRSPSARPTARPPARPVILLVAIAVVLASASAPAPAQRQLSARPQTASLDSDAPPGAPPHWLPGERWVMQHWLPYDETRLYRLLGVTRGDVWRWLRDDTRSLAQLAERRGWAPQRLAAALVAPWRGELREPSRLALLESRALRTLTQGHLSQHLFFHSLHQNAIPDNAARIFGVASREEFQALRRAELSPLQICRLNGLSRAHAQRSAESTLRAEVAAGVTGQAIPAAQAERLLTRQLRQVPRWLQQTRYNGPPPLKQPRASIATASNYSNNAVLAADGASLAFESYEASLKGAKTRGEIGVLARSPASPQPVLVSRPNAGERRTPRSAYNPAISAGGRFVAFESADGNLNFAKRYGEMQVFVRDTRRGTTALASPAAVDEATGRPVPRSAYNPSLSADGRLVAFESSEAARGELDVFVRDLRRRRTLRVTPGVPGADDVYEPRLSGDGRFVVFTALARGVQGAQSEVFIQDLARGRTRLVSRSDGPRGARADGESWEPSVSRDGRFVAFTSVAANLGAGAGTARRSRVFVRDLAAGTTTLVGPGPGGDGLAADAWASEPSLSADGRRVAFVARNATDRRSGVFVRDLPARVTMLASRASGAGGPPADGSSAHPSISADGRAVAFTSDAWNLDGAKCNAARGIFVRRIDAATTTLVSAGDGANRYAGPTKGSSAGADMRLALLCA